MRQNVILPALEKKFGNQLLNLTFDLQRRQAVLVMGGARVPSILEGLRGMVPEFAALFGVGGGGKRQGGNQPCGQNVTQKSHLHPISPPDARTA